MTTNLDRSSVTVNGDEPDVDAVRLDNGKWVWVWTSPGGACHQGAKHYRRPGDALRAGREWRRQQA